MDESVSPPDISEARTPRRIQLSRAGGWRKPKGAVVVSRPTHWGNPVLVVDGDRAAAVRAYAQLLAVRPDLVAAARTALAGKTLACWCPVGKPCHGEVLAAVAAGASPQEAVDHLFPPGR
jgi:hypothetical protein